MKSKVSFISVVKDKIKCVSFFHSFSFFFHFIILLIQTKICYLNDF